MAEFDLLKHIQKKNDGNTVVWIFNIGVEKYWSQDLSMVRNEKEEVVVNHVEEMNFLLTKKQDVMIMRKMPEMDYLSDMIKRGFEIPTILVPSFEDEKAGISEIILKDDALLNQLSVLKKEREKVFFVPYGVSELEEKIAEKCGMELIGGPNIIAHKINNKIFSLNVAEQLKFPTAKGKICKSFEDVQDSSLELLAEFEKIIIKQPCGASGKGLWVVDNEKKLLMVMQIIKKLCLRKGVAQEFIVEGWYEKKSDINYQIYVRGDGRIETFSIKEQLLDETVYIGSLMPPRLPETLLEKCRKCGEQIGKLLYAQGYNGLLGVDAMVTKDNVFIPIIEINARFTLSTYISFLLNRNSNSKLLSFYMRIPIVGGENYGTICERISGEVDDAQVFCYVSESINSRTVEEYGRLFVVAISDNVEDVIEKKKRIEEVWR